MFHTASVLLLLCGPLAVMSMTCLRCPNVNTTSSCHVSVACAADEHCYTEKRVSGTSIEYYSMGCVKSLYCPSTDIDVVIGKKDTFREDVEVDDKLKREALCFKCCSTDNCNEFLCDVVEKPEAFTTGTELELRLMGGYTKYEGTVQVFHNNSWGDICDDGWHYLPAQLVCSMLGFQKYSALAIIMNGFNDNSNTSFWLDDVTCHSNATILWDCTHRPWGENDCGPGERAGVKCYPAIPPKDDFIFLLDTQLQEFLKVDISSETYDVIPTDMKYNPRTFDYDPGQNKIFFFDDLYKQIISIYSDGSGLSIIKQLDFNSEVNGIAVDPVNDIVFYSDNDLDAIASVNVDGSNHRYVISANLNSPRSVALLPKSKKIFWTEWGVAPKIESANYDGTSRIVLASTNLKWPNSLTIDYSESRLYFLDGGMGTIESMDFEGSFRRVILHDPVAHLFSLDVFSEYIYFTALEKSGPYKVRKDGSGLSPIGPQDFNRLSQIKFNKYGTDYTGETKIQQKSSFTTFVRVDGISSSAKGSVGVYVNGQWRDVCTTNWNDAEAQVFCSMLGFNRRESQSGTPLPVTSWITPLYIGDCLGSEKHVAGCPSLEDSNWPLLNCTGKATLTCSSQRQSDFQLDNFVIFFNTSTKDFIRMDLNTNSYTRKFFTPENITAVVYDPLNQRIYYNVVDKIATTSVIKTTDLITSGTSLTISNIFSESDINSLAIDTNSHTIFYTDVKQKLIGALSTSGSGSRVVLTGINEPRYIAVDKQDLTLFWTEWGPVPKIEKADYDGTDRRPLATTGLRNPNGIAVDSKAKLVYFCDAGTHTIEVMNTDGSNRRVLFTDLSSSLDALTITSKYIYYSDKNKRHIMRLNRDGANHTSAGPPDFPHVTGLHAFDSLLN